MAQQEHLSISMKVRGIYPGAPVAIENAKWPSATAVEVGYKEAPGNLEHELTQCDREIDLEVPKSGQICSFDGVDDKFGFLLAFISGLIFSPSASWGCGICMWALSTQHLPAIIPWAILSVAWFIALSVLANRHGRRLLLVPHPGIAVVFVVVACALELAFTGPLITILLLVPCGLNTLSSFSRSISPSWSSSLRTGVRWTGVVAVGGMTFFGFHSSNAAKEMDIADRIMAWQGTVLERTLLRELQEKEPESLGQYRKLMREGSGSILWLTSKRVAEVGEPEIDVPILIEALDSERSASEFKNEFNSSDYGMEREFIEKALCQLTGLSLQQKTSAEEWEKEWDRKLAGE